MEVSWIRLCVSHLTLAFMVLLLNTCCCVKKVRLLDQNGNSSLEYTTFNLQLKGDFNGNLVITDRTKMDSTGEAILELSKEFSRSHMLFSYECFPGWTHTKPYMQDPRLPWSRRLLNTRINCPCGCTCIFCDLQDKLSSLRCTCQPSWSASSHWHITSDTKREAVLDAKCSALIILASLLGVACLGLLVGLCAANREREAITNETIKQRSVRATLRASLPEEISFRTLRKLTNNFSHVLGHGGFGLVYAGVFKNGSKVAVKVLDRSLKQGEKEFRAEVLLMATTQHINLMRLQGFCSEGTHRILVYEFMPNRSLDKWIFGSSGKQGKLDWSVRFSIAIGTARGLAYLHEECLAPILHLDVKPENILLDDDFTPKLADFGLSRLISKNQTQIVTKTRGTPGYLAPEWVQRSSITPKVDVYSFGMVLLELVSGREVINMGLGAEEWYLPAWVVRTVEEGRTIDIVDPLILDEVQYFYEDQVKRAIEVALCCIQEDATLRPRMSRAVQMLEGMVEPQSPMLTKRIVTEPTSTTLKAKVNGFMDAITGGISDITLDGSERLSAISSGRNTDFLLTSYVPSPNFDL